MSIFRNRLFIFLVTLILALVPMAAFCQSGPPPLPPYPFLDSYSFDETNWLSDWGYAPIGFTNLAIVSVWDGDALLLDTTNVAPGAYLNYRIVETNGFTNIAFPAGTMVAVFINTWASADTNQMGSGPGEQGYLLGAGDFTSNSPYGLWGVWVDQAGTNLTFGGVSNGTSTTFVSTPISWPSNAVHLLGIAYPTNGTTMYLDGAQVATGSPVSIVPATNVWSNGFFVGSDAFGEKQARAVFWDLEFGNSNCYTVFWSNMFGPSYFTNWWASTSNAYYTWLSGEGGGFSFFGGVSLPPDPTNSFNTNYADYSSFWLEASNSSTNLHIRVVNTLSNITYQILTNRDLTTTNWHVWQTVVGSNSITAAPTLSLGTNTLYFNARMVWSTCTNYSPAVPDWWTQLYFGSTSCVDPKANPSGDGIDNWDKYLLGLNPNFAYASPLAIFPPGGNYTSIPTVTVFSLTGATIKYTTNGSIPSATNGISVASGVPITNLPGTNFTLKAWESGLVSNVPTVAVYTIIPATPTFSIPSGLYSSGTALQIICVTTNATVRYTTNGVDPTTNSTSILPTAAITLTTNVTVKTAAWLGTNVSPVAQVAYIIEPISTNLPANDNFTNATVLSGSAGQFSGTTMNGTLEFFETNHSSEFSYEVGYGNSVWYKWTAPSNGTAVFNTYNYAAQFSFYVFPSGTSSNPTNLVATTATQNYYPGIYFTVPVTNGVTYYLAVAAYDEGPFAGSWQYVEPTLTPIFRPDTGTYTNDLLVTVSDNDTNAVIRYTLDGSSPATNSMIVLSGGTVLINTNETLKAAAWNPQLEESAVKSAAYTINPSTTNSTLTATAPVLSPTDVVFTNSMTITLTDTNDTGATIFYTLDGSIPSLASASVSSGGTLTISNSAILSASSWVTNKNFSPIASSQYAQWGVDTAEDGIPDSGKLQIGANDILAPAANLVNPNPFAHGLNNLQVYENQSVLIADNYSTENDGIPDWWLVQNGYSVTTPATALGANGQTLLVSFTAGLSPNNPSSQPGLTPPIDFHMAHGPTNSMLMVLDTVRPGMAKYRLTCTNTDAGLPGLSEDFAPDQSLDLPGQKLGRCFQMTNPVPPGNWIFTMQGVNSNDLWSTTSSNTFERYQNWFNAYPPVNQQNYSYLYSGVPVPIVGYTNNNAIKEPLLAQILRAESDVWNDAPENQWPPNALSDPLLFDSYVQSLTTSSSWGTLTFQYYPDPASPTYAPAGLASYFTSICATPNVSVNCDSYYSNNIGVQLAPLQAVPDTNGNQWFVMPDDSWGDSYTLNPAGLKYLSVTYRIGSGTPATLYPGQSNMVPNTSFTFEVALETETPTLQAINYYFDGRQFPQYENVPYTDLDYSSYPPDFFAGSYQAYDWTSISPGQNIVPVCVTNPVIVAQVGRTVNLQAWSEVIAVRPNGTQLTNQPYFIDQDFAQAYLCNPTNGDVPRTLQTNYNGQYQIDTNAAVKTGILSPNLNYPYDYASTHPARGADFTPTKPGKVIVTTMPDSNGFYGEVTIYVIDLQVDANHDGIMDNRDLTSVNNPMQFWVNNDVDRWHTVDGSDAEQDSLQINDSSLVSWQEVPDCQYRNGIGQPAIPSTRDLEDYARLWIPGLTNLMQVLPTGYGINLQWRNNSGAGIRLFGATDTNGGTNYLFDGATATNQIDTGWYPCLGYVSSNQPLPVSTAAWVALNGLPASDHFIFCGTSPGNDELVLQVTNQYGGEVGEASVFLNLKDIKQMYERWTVGDDPSTAPTMIAVPAYDDLPPGVGSFQYSSDSQTDSHTPYILHVHGSNMEPWEKDRFAERMYKRLYWLGYQGRFGSFRWPTSWGFDGSLYDLAFDSAHFDVIEFAAWNSGQGLSTLLRRLNILYPGEVILSAHSMGNIAASEALRQATNAVVKVYTAFQSAGAAQSYDPNASTLSLGSFEIGESNYFLHFYASNSPCYFSGSLGASSWVNFFNTNDYVLNQWFTGQEYKPDTSLDYGYSAGTFEINPGGRILTFPTNTYEIFAFCLQPRCNCIGEYPGLGGLFNPAMEVDLQLPPYNFGNTHRFHSGEFRSDNMERWPFWNQLLKTDGLK